MTRPAHLFGRGSWTEASRIAPILRKETVGGVLLLAGTVVALVWANSPWAESYVALRDTTVGPAALHLDLSLGTWAADGLLAVFFFVAGGRRRGAGVLLLRGRGGAQARVRRGGPARPAPARVAGGRGGRRHGRSCRR